MAYFLGGLGAGILLTAGFFYWNIGRHKRIPSLTKFVAFSIVLLILYTMAEMTVSTISGVSHETLTSVFFACFGGEILSCALIKIFKLRNNETEEQRYVERD